MQTKLFSPALKQPLETRLMRYALAGGALLAVPAAQASVIYSGPLNLVATTSNSVDVSFNPLAAGATDFTLGVTSGDITVTSGAGDSLDIGPLTLGTAITLADTTTSGPDNVVKINAGPVYSGPWANMSSPAYLGVQFTASAQTYLGWAELQMDQATPSVTLLGYAYNDQAGQPINAGETPEPSSLSLFALGAAGVLALRRRRQMA